MREKIERFAKGIFSYSNPQLLTSIASINIPAEAGKSMEGSFVVSSTGTLPFKGFVVASDSLISFEKNTFYGIENEIRYRFDATYLDINDTVQGSFTVISEYGEMDIPFQAKCRVPACHTSIGPASDLFHFTSLAQSNWTEARDLFKSEEFRNTLTYYNSEFDTLSTALLKSGNVSLALEDFLVSAHKKKPVKVSCETQTINFEIPWDSASDDGTACGNYEGEIVLTRDTWGYLQLAVETMSDFIVPERKIIWSDDFSGNEFRLKLKADVSKTHGGTSYSAVLITGINVRIMVPVVLKRSSQSMKERLSRRRRRYLEMKLETTALDYRMGRISKNRFIHEEEKLLNDLRDMKQIGFKEQFLKCYILYLSGRTSQAEVELQLLSEEEENFSEREYALELYMSALLGVGEEKRNLRDVSVPAQTVEQLTGLYDRTQDAIIALLRIEADEKMRMGRQARYGMLKNSVTGSYSPFVLSSVCRLVNEEPTVMKEYDGFDLHVLMYGLKNDLINKDAIRFAAYLAMHTKNSSLLHVRVLEMAVAQFRTVEVLEALCRHIMLADIKGERAYQWLIAGIRDGIVPKGICEKCISQAGSAFETPLPKELVSYFESGAQLPEHLKASFYANIYRFRTSREHAGEAFRAGASEFVKNCLLSGEIDDDLAFLYNTLLDADELDDAVICALPGIVFKHKVVVEWEGAVKIIVSHKELSKEESFEIKDGVAYCDIFTNDAVILAADQAGNRVVWSDGDPERIITDQKLLKVCLERCSDDARVNLYSLEAARYRADGQMVVDLIKRIVYLPDLEKKFELDCKRELIEYYYENLEGDRMEKLLVSLDLSRFNRTDRARMLSLMIQRELYSLAMRNMQMYGFMGVDIKRLSELASKLIDAKDEVIQTPLFTVICTYVLFHRYSGPGIAQHVADKYDGPSEYMYKLWRQALDTNVDTAYLEERLLYQILFTQNDMSFANAVFKHYYGHGTNRRLIRAYLSYYAYRCLTFDQMTEGEMLDIMRHESLYDDNEICSLALLKSYSHAQTLTEQDKMFVERKLEEFASAGKILPFFRDFAGVCELPQGIFDKHYVEYHTDPSLLVKIHYCVNDDGNGKYEDELMKDVGYGIFVKEFILFCGETLQYYISEESKDNYAITESGEISVDPDELGSEETGYHQLNLIITAREMGDAKTMLGLLEGYIKNDNIAEQLFKAIV
ncbi:MAG: DUF5717 family protein [Lachnospiraceae bacterium]|nr:DUF5717 family protein [Lachnospiraceae bacterium]